MYASLFWMTRAHIWQANEWDVKYDTESAMQSYCVDKQDRYLEDISIIGQYLVKLIYDYFTSSYIVCL